MLVWNGFYTMKEASMLCCCKTPLPWRRFQCLNITASQAEWFREDMKPKKCEVKYIFWRHGLRQISRLSSEMYRSILPMCRFIVHVGNWTVVSHQTMNKCAWYLQIQIVFLKRRRNQRKSQKRSWLLADKDRNFEKYLFGNESTRNFSGTILGSSFHHSNFPICIKHFD